MIVPGPGRRNDEVARLHPGFFTFYRRVRARTLDDEAQSNGRMPVGGRNLTRRNELQAGVERIRDEMLALQTRIL